jgi:hypothetical protein
MSAHDLDRIMPSHADLVRMAMDSDEPEYIAFSRIIEGMRNLTVADIEPLAAQLQHLCQMEER